MSELEAILERAAASKDAFSSRHLVGHAFQNRLLARRAVGDRRANAVRPRALRHQGIDSDEIGMREQEWQLWQRNDARVRSEYVIGRELVVVVANHNRWTRSSPTLGSVSGGGAGRPLRTLIGPAAVLFDPAPFLEVVVPVTSRRRRVAGRDALELTVQPVAARGRSRLALREAGVGADEYDVTVDVERGFLLGVSARSGTTVFQSVEATTVELDVELGDDVFVAPREHGERPRRMALTRRVRVDDVVDAVRFLLYQPRPSPSPVPPHVSLLEGDRRGIGPERVVFTYAVVEDGHRGQLRLTCAGVDLPRGGETWTAQGDLEVTMGKGRVIDRAKVRRRIGTTTCELESSVLSLERLIELARSLAPVSTSGADVDLGR